MLMLVNDLVLTKYIKQLTFVGVNLVLVKSFQVLPFYFEGDSGFRNASAVRGFRRRQTTTRSFRLRRLFAENKLASRYLTIKFSRLYHRPILAQLN